MANLNQIVNVNIDIATPAVSKASFGRLLIVGAAPTATGKTVPDVAVYTTLKEVTDAGYVTQGTGADPIGVAARIAFSQNPTTDKLYVSVTKDSEVDITLALNRALAIDGWYVVCPAGIETTSYELIAQWVEAQTEKPKIFAYTYTSAANPITATTYYRTMAWYGCIEDGIAITDNTNANLYLHVAACAKILTYDSGSETFAFKQLAAVLTTLASQTTLETLITANVNYYAEYGGKNITMNGKVLAGEWIDVIRFRDWLKNEIQYNIYNLFIMNSKIPYTNSGIALVENQLIAALKAGQIVGGIAEDEYDTDGNLIPGWTESVPNSRNISASQKASRVLDGINFTARIAGAIHAVTINGVLTY